MFGFPEFWDHLALGNLVQKTRKYSESGIKSATDLKDRGRVPPISTTRSMESKLTFDHITPPAISIECPADEDPETLGYCRLVPTTPSPIRSPSSDSTPRGFSSLDTDRDIDTPVLDEFAQFVNASIHPPNELSVPRCYPSPPTPNSTNRHNLSTPSTAPNSRRPSTTSRLSAPNHRNTRSLSLGYSSHSTSNKGRPIQSRSYSRSSGGSSLNSPPQLSPIRPQLRRESAQDLGDGEDGDSKLNIGKE